MVQDPREGRSFTIGTFPLMRNKELHSFSEEGDHTFQLTRRRRPVLFPACESFRLEFAPNHWGFKGTQCFSASNLLHKSKDPIPARSCTSTESRDRNNIYARQAADTKPISRSERVCELHASRLLSVGKRKMLLPSCGLDEDDASIAGVIQPGNRHQERGESRRKRRGVLLVGAQRLQRRRDRASAMSMPTGAAFMSLVQQDDPSDLPAARPAEDLRALFNEIDVNGDGRLTENELRMYAERHGLPTTYVREFLDLARHSGRRQREGQPPRWPSWFTAQKLPPVATPCVGNATGVGSSPGGPPPLPPPLPPWEWARRAVRSATAPLSVEFCEFRAFMERKDEALRDSFARIDDNGDGEITLAELERGMRCVRVMCGGQYHPVRNLCLARMMKRLHKGRSSSIRYQEFRDFFTLLPSSEYLMDYWLESSCTPSVDLGSKVHVASPSSASSDASSVQYSMEPRGSPWNHLLAGGLAGAVSRTITAPLETLRLQMMVSSSAARGAESSLSALARSLYRQAGWRAFFRGNLTNVVRSAPQKAIDFFAFEGYKRVLLHASAGPIGMQLMTAGALAGATSTLILYPLDVVRSRLTIQTSYGSYKGILDALRRISMEEGVPSLYRGLRPSIVSIIPEAGITYGAFDILKRTYLRVAKTDKVPLVPTMVCGVVSASTGQFVAYPLELVARRLQVAGGSTSAREIFFKILAEEGAHGLYRGIVPATLKMIPMAIISFSVYESAKGALMWLSQLEEARKIEAASLEEERRSRIQTKRECPPL